MKVLGLLIFMALGLMGCKTVHYQKAEVLNRNDNISLLKGRIEVAKANGVDVLAPQHFGKAKTLFDQAIKAAQESQDPQAGNKTAQDGLQAVVHAENLATEARGVLNNAIQKRARAQAAHAHLLFKSEFDALDKELTEAGKAIEDGKKNFALEKNVDLSVRYEKLEGLALKSNLNEISERAYEQAVEANAKRLAPITLKAAKSELDIARKIIDVEKENFDKAQFHAEQARYLALRARYIAELVTGFKREDLSDEQMILWYQSQLEQIHSPLSTAIKFDKPNREVVNHFESELKHIAVDKRQFETKTLSKEAHFREISELFTAEEAEVVRRGDDLIIRSYGFHFPVGQSELVSRNFDLLNKFVTAINKFPNAEIEVEGHTDSSGSKRINMRLSEKRSKNIADFLIKAAKIDANRVKSLGIGDERPIFSNETQEGRSKNRRIEIIIKNAR